MKAANHPHVVIVGAGFGGLAAAKRLAGRDVDVTLVDRRNHHVFQPLLYQVATAALSPADIAGPIRAIFSGAENVRVLLDEVTGLKTVDARVDLKSGAKLHYDWLILATGGRHSYFGHEEWSAYAPGLKSIEDALAIRRKILLALEQAETETDAERRKALLTFVVIGGGATGVEMAGAIAELARRSVSRDFRSITPECSRVILIEAGEHLLPTFPPQLSNAAERSLEELGVEVRLGAPVRDVGEGYVEWHDQLIFARTVIWAAGVTASPAAEWLKADHDKNGRVFVEADLRLPGHRNIFAIGDTANAPARSGGNLPAVAPVAKQQGRFVADLILGRRAGEFTYRDFGNLATVGRSRAVIDMGGLRLSGFVAWLIWSVAHVWFLPQPSGRHDQLALELPHLPTQRAPDHRRPRTATGPSPRASPRKEMRMKSLASEVADLGQTVLVLQGGGALGAYQVGVYEALHEAGIAPQWVIGTSIGAINAALIVGSRPDERLGKLCEFWSRVTNDMFVPGGLPAWLATATRNTLAISSGVPSFFSPSPLAFASPHYKLGADSAGYYSVSPLRRTLEDLVDVDQLNSGETRITVGASSVRTAEMRYFDSRDMPLSIDHVMASGALPPGFPPVRIDGELYWDGGILSNTPVEVVFDDNPRRSGLVFAVHIWNPHGAEPETMWEVMNRQKDVQYSSRAAAHIKRQRQLHRMRHVIAELSKMVPDEKRRDNRFSEMTSYGCLTRMHVVRLLAPALDYEDHSKDIDFSAGSIRRRREAGYDDTMKTLEKAPWRAPVDEIEGFILHEASGGRMVETAAAR